MLLATMPVAGQAPIGRRGNERNAGEGVDAPRTPDGQPDLQGFWTNTTYTPLERPKDVDEGVLHAGGSARTLSKQAAAARKRADRARNRSPTCTTTSRSSGWTGARAAIALNLRTSLIVDPPDGRMPPMTAEGQKRAADARRGEKANGCRHRRRAEPAARRAVHHHGPRRAADAAPAPTTTTIRSSRARDT